MRPPRREERRTDDKKKPTTNYTQAHVDAYSAFLDALAKAVRGQGGKVGMDVSSWGILQ